MTTSKLTREAIIKLRKEGRWPGRPPYGFKVVNGYLEKDDNWNHIIEAFKLRSQGARWAVVCDKLGRMSRRGARRLLERYGDIDGFIHFTNTNLRKASKE
jgi:DNA invertase Pin-like site-specific DNA recombinase